MKERFDFEKGQLSMKDTTDDPIVLLNKWVENAKTQGVHEYQAMVISTLNSEHNISSRVVYFRDVIEGGFVFYTNFNSQKATEIAVNNNVAINIFWKELEQQIRINGSIKKVTPEISDAYFNSRPRESQIGAWASNQSEQIPNREYLEKELIRFQQEFEGIPVPRPKHWGGYIVSPSYYEFWQGRKSRLHDRISFEKMNDGWKKYRLAP